MKTKTVDIDKLCQEVAEVLAQGEGEWIEEMANKILTHKVKYIGGELFEQDIPGDDK
jgi:hypothetical protein